jgi:hypothetical protein
MTKIRKEAARAMAIRAFLPFRGKHRLDIDSFYGCRFAFLGPTSLPQKGDRIEELL